jgi:hypothetical protein
MPTDDRHVSDTQPTPDWDTQVLEPLKTALASADEATRYGVLSSLFSELAERAVVDATKLQSGRLEELSRKLSILAEEKAAINDMVVTTKADLSSRQIQLDGERARAAELERVINDQRARLETVQQQLRDRESELVARNAEVYEARAETDKRLLQAQRAELKASDQSKLHALEASRMELSSRAESLRAELEQLRAEKNEEIDRLKAELRAAQSGASESGGELLAELWQRLASEKPPLVEGHIPPNVHSGERLFDSFVHFVRFVDAMEGDVRVFLSKYTKHNDALKVPWEVYAKSAEVYKTVQEMLDPRGGKPVGPLRMRLKMLNAWIHAAAVANDSAIESIASELQSHLMGEEGVGSDPNFKIKDYVRKDGHYLFMEHMRRMRDQAMADVYARGTGS